MANKRDNLNISNKGWETVIDFTEINENGVSGREILEIIKKIDG